MDQDADAGECGPDDGIDPLELREAAAALLVLAARYELARRTLDPPASLVAGRRLNLASGELGSPVAVRKARVAKANDRRIERHLRRAVEEVQQALGRAEYLATVERLMAHIGLISELLSTAFRDNKVDWTSHVRLVAAMLLKSLPSYLLPVSTTLEATETALASSEVITHLEKGDSQAAGLLVIGALAGGPAHKATSLRPLKHEIAAEGPLLPDNRLDAAVSVQLAFHYLLHAVHMPPADNVRARRINAEAHGAVCEALFGPIQLSDDVVVLAADRGEPVPSTPAAREDLLRRRYSALGLCGEAIEVQVEWAKRNGHLDRGMEEVNRVNARLAELGLGHLVAVPKL